MDDGVEALGVKAVAGRSHRLQELLGLASVVLPSGRGDGLLKPQRAAARRRGGAAAPSGRGCLVDGGAGLRPARAIRGGGRRLRAAERDHAAAGGAAFPELHVSGWHHHADDHSADLADQGAGATKGVEPTAEWPLRRNNILQGAVGDEHERGEAGKDHGGALLAIERPRGAGLVRQCGRHVAPHARRGSSVTDRCQSPASRGQLLSWWKSRTWNLAERA
mmetsp:Transcript_62606/g.181488  ORF Transcript_62606/g.181488 Transcript_62606/m.181488 type:complete len:220 (+) Transcript_62606:1328-1987(+)